MKNTIQKLLDFVSLAEKSRKYFGSNGRNFRSALKVIEKELNDSELNSLDTLEKNLDQIFNSIYNKKGTLSAASVQVYKARIKSLINDYKNYGTDSAKMNSWQREYVRRARAPKENKEESFKDESYDRDRLNKNSLSKDATRFELPLGSGDVAIIITPANITKNHIKKIKGYIEFLENNLVEDAGGA